MTKAESRFVSFIGMFIVVDFRTKLNDRTKDLVNNRGGAFVALLSPAD